MLSVSVILTFWILCSIISIEDFASEGFVVPKDVNLFDSVSKFDNSTDAVFRPFISELLFSVAIS